MDIFQIIAVAAVGYILGSISFAVIIARLNGKDIFQEGSGNPGATNVKRVCGKKAGNLTFALDAFKGFVATGWPMLMGVEDPALLGIIGMIAAIVGHSFSVFIRFRGGKGGATTMGGLLALAPLVLVMGVLTWVVVFYASRYVSLASIVFGASLPLYALLLRSSGDPYLVPFFLLGLAVLIVVRHRSNLQRLLNGTENRFERKKKS